MAEEDMIFGKKRHFFGGIEPSTMKRFAVSYMVLGLTPVARLTMEFPDDTVVNGQTLATVEGCAICRKEDSYPENEFDGFLFNVKKNDAIVKVDDEDVKAGKTYFYAAFPYTTQGVYSRNMTNTVAVDMIEGPVPGDMVTFTVKNASSSASAQVKIDYELPNNVAGAIIRRSTEGYPLTEKDGTSVGSVSEKSGTIYDSNVDANTTYYYTAFPYSENNIYNRRLSKNNRGSVEVLEYTISSIPSCKILEMDIETEMVNPKYTSNAGNNSISAAAVRIYANLPLKFQPKDGKQITDMEAIYFVKRYDRFAEGPEDIPSETNSLGGPWMVDATSSVGLMEVNHNDNYIYDYKSKGLQSLASTFIREAELVDNDIYFSLFVKYNGEPLVTTVSEDNSRLFKTNDYIQPMVQECRVFQYGTRIDFAFVLPKGYTRDKFESLFKANCCMVYPMSSAAQTGKTLPENGIYLEKIDPANDWLRIQLVNTTLNAEATIGITRGKYVYNQDEPSYLDEVIYSQELTTAIPNIQNGAILWYAMLLNDPDEAETKRFVPIRTPHVQGGCLYNATAATSVQNQQILTNQLTMMEALADIYMETLPTE